MLKNKLFIAVAAISMMAPVGASAALMQAPAVVSAATYNNGNIHIKRGTKLYYIMLNSKQTGVKSIKKYSRKGKQLAVRGGKSKAYWSVTKKGVKYYYIGSTGGKMLAVRARDTKHGSVPTLAKYMETHSANKNIQIPIKHIDPATLAVSAKIKSETIYGVVDTQSNKVNMASDKLQSGAQINVMFKITGMFKSSDGQAADGYYATMGDKTIIVPASAVDIAESSIPDQNTFEQTLQTKDKEYVQQQVDQYKADHNLK